MELTRLQWIGAIAGFAIGVLIVILIGAAKSFFLTPFLMLIFGGGLGAAGAYLAKFLEG